MRGQILPIAFAAAVLLAAAVITFHSGGGSEAAPPAISGKSKAAAQKYGSSFYCIGDADGDGRPDLALMRHDEPPMLFINGLQGFRDGFADSNIILGDPMRLYVDKHGCSFADVDNDGDLDLYITNGGKGGTGIEYSQMYLNGGSGNFTLSGDDVLRNAGGRGRNSAWGDVDNDGLLDVFVANLILDGRPSFVAKNLGNGSYGLYASFPEINGLKNTYGSWNDYD